MRGTIVSKEVAKRMMFALSGLTMLFLLFMLQRWSII